MKKLRFVLGIVLFFVFISCMNEEKVKVSVVIQKNFQTTLDMHYYQTPQLVAEVVSVKKIDNTNYDCTIKIIGADVGELSAHVELSMRDAIKEFEFTEDSKAALKALEVTQKFEKIKIAMEEKRYADVLNQSETYFIDFPETNQYREVKEIHSAVSAIITEERKREDAEKKKALAKIKIDKDEINNISWYSDRVMDNISGSRVELYFGVSEAGKLSPRCRLVFRYNGTTWVIANKFIFNIDGERLEFVPDFNEVKRDNGLNDDYSSWLLEYVDVSSSNNADLLGILKKVSMSKKALMRIQGDTLYKDREITEREKQGIINVLAAYSLL
ncbi:MAG: hypothetical protein LBD20_02650 [Spirochaetaceae bacterium]|jgi:hypothetical protein|nr:hypothetical protein [Spirochaetaceae bacterium]